MDPTCFVYKCTLVLLVVVLTWHDALAMRSTHSLTKRNLLKKRQSDVDAHTAAVVHNFASTITSDPKHITDSWGGGGGGGGGKPKHSHHGGGGGGGSGGGGGGGESTTPTIRPVPQGSTQGALDETKGCYAGVHCILVTDSSMLDSSDALECSPSGLICAYPKGCSVIATCPDQSYAKVTFDYLDTQRNAVYSVMSAPQQGSIKGMFYATQAASSMVPDDMALLSC